MKINNLFKSSGFSGGTSGHHFADGRARQTRWDTLSLGFRSGLNRFPIW
jgi:hypothetical protein